ncbi:MAG: SlyX family protein [Burkholderiaceae bacterium]
MQSDANQRLIDLEIKASYSEDLLDELNKTVFRQQEQIDALLRDVLQLRQQTPADAPPIPNDLRDELPPHY